MIAMSPEANLLVVWVTFLVLGLAGLAAALVWAVRKGQFRDQDRARYLPLTGKIPDAYPDQDAEKRTGRRGTARPRPQPNGKIQDH